jgi:hypothetical protein
MSNNSSNPSSSSHPAKLSAFPFATKTATVSAERAAEVTEKKRKRRTGSVDEVGEGMHENNDSGAADADNDDDAAGGNEEVAAKLDSTPVVKKPKRRKPGSEPAPAARTPEEQVELFTRLHALAAPELTDLERNGACNLTSEHFLNVSGPWSDVPGLVGVQEDANLCGVQLITLSSAALRACEVVREIAGSRLPLIKLFAKHLKKKDQIEQLRERVHVLGVGTPSRVAQLMEEGALNAEEVKCVVFDMLPGKKPFCVLDEKIVSKDAFKLFREFILPQVEKGTCKLALWYP